MTGITLSAKDWLNIITHIKQWITNLQRAGKERKAQSIKALRDVIRAVRQTEIYIRKIKEGGKPSIEEEKKLSLLWTELSFALTDIKLDKLAKKCMIKGKDWAVLSKQNTHFFDTAITRLSEIERTTLLMLEAIAD